MEKKSFLWWVIYILLFIWQLPQNLVALVMLPFLGKLTLVKEGKYSFCFVGENMSGGISLGNFCFVSEGMAKSRYREEYIAHELFGHTWDSRVMGPLYLLIVGLPSILNAMFDFTDCYYDWFPEKWANKHAGLVSDRYGRLSFRS